MSSDPVRRAQRLAREAKRRGVVRVALVYLAVSFVILQAAGLVVPLLLLPEVVTRAVLALLILGFPIALVAGWAYDLTPDGVQRAGAGVEDQADADGPVADRAIAAGADVPSGRDGTAWLTASTLLIVGSLVALALALWWVTPRLDLRTRTASLQGAADPGEAGGSPSALRLLLAPPPGTRLTGNPFDMAISPDGRTVVFAAVDGDTIRFYRRDLNRFETRVIPGAGGSRPFRPFFSPDGRQIGYHADGRLWTVALAGGSPRPVTELVTWFGGAVWGPGDTIVYADGQLGLFRIPASGGEPAAIRTVDRGGTNFRDPAWLEEGETLLVTQGVPGGPLRVLAVPVSGGAADVVLAEGHGARYLRSDGLLLYRLSGELFVRRLEPGGALEPGPAVPVLGGLARTEGGRSHVAVADDGTLVYLPDSGLRVEYDHVWVDTAGRRDPLDFPVGRGQGYRISPDGSRVVFHRPPEGEESVDLWVYETDSGHLRRVTRDQGDNWWPIWGADGERIFHNSSRASIEEPGSGLDLYVTSLGPDQEARLLAETAGSIQPQSLTADGTVLAFLDNTIDDAEEGEETLRDIWFLSLEGDEADRRPFLRTRFDEMHPAIAPNGRWIAYVSDESGEREVYLTTFPEKGEIRRVSTGGGVGPVWAPASDALYYRSPDGDRVYRARIRPGAGQSDESPETGEPQVIIEGSFFSDRPWGRNYDLHPDGERFLLLERTAEEAPSSAPQHLRVLLDALSEIRARVAEAGG